MIRRILWAAAILLLAVTACSLPSSLAQRSTAIPSAIPATETPTLTPTAAPTTVHLLDDGSGDYASLVQAVESVAPGSTIILAEGSYDVSPNLIVTKPITIQGAGMDKTFITASTGQLVADFRDAGIVNLSGITFQYTGTEPANVVTIEGGTVTISDCRFTGGVFLASEDKTPVGSGLLIYGKTDGLIANSTFDENGYIGLVVSGDSIASSTRDSGYLSSHVQSWPFGPSRGCGGAGLQRWL